MGNYIIRSLIGKGGMGTVYLAEHPRIGRQVAVKVLARHLAVQEKMARRFEVEAQAMARLSHSNIIEIYDFGNLEDGTPYYAMELLEGRELRQVMKEREKISAAEALPYLEQICAALQAAHDRSVVHRDLKPENIFVLAEEPMRLKILDFGIAKILEGDEGTGITTSGMLLGSPVFVSPEQVAGESDDISPRTDLYSLGVLLYWMLCGSPPFWSGAAGVLVAMHLKDQPPPLLVREPSVPARVAEVVHQCLEKAPDDRPASATALLDAYRTALGSVPRRVTPPSGEVEAAAGLAMEATVEATLPGLGGADGDEATVRDLDAAMEELLQATRTEPEHVLEDSSAFKETIKGEEDDPGADLSRRITTPHKAVEEAAPVSSPPVQALVQGPTEERPTTPVTLPPDLAGSQQLPEPAHPSPGDGPLKTQVVTSAPPPRRRAWVWIALGLLVLTLSACLVYFSTL